MALLLQGELRLPQSHPAAAGFPANRSGRRENEISQTTCGRPACRAMIRQAAAVLDQADDLRHARCMSTVSRFVRGFMQRGHGAASRVSKAKTSMPCAEPLATNDTDDLTENCSAHYKSMNEYFCLILWQPTNYCPPNLTRSSFLCAKVRLECCLKSYYATMPQYMMYASQLVSVARCFTT